MKISEKERKTGRQGMGTVREREAVMATGRETKTY